MKIKWMIAVLCVVSFLCWLPSTLSAEDTAQDGSDGFELLWWNVGSGAGVCDGGSYRLVDAIGQAAAGESAGDSYVLLSGSVSLAAHPPASEIFSDGFESGDTSTWSATTGS